MRTETESVRRALGFLELAPFDSAHWQPALRAMSHASNGWLGQLIGMTLTAVVNCYSEAVEDDVQEWVEVGGTNPATNPVIRRGFTTRPGDNYAEFEIIAEEERRRHPLLGDFYGRKNVPHLCIANIAEVRDAKWFTVTMSSAKQGRIGASERRTFRMVSQAAGRAVHAAAVIKNDGAKLLAGAFDALSVTAFVCDAFGGVIAMSERAESLASSGSLLRLRDRGLLAHSAPQTAALERAILSAARHEPGTAPDPRNHIALNDVLGRPVATAQAIPLPRDRCDIGLGAAALVILDERSKNDLSTIAARFGLTKAEAEIAGLLLQRLHIEEIALRRGVSPETVRSQSKAVYAKTGVRRQRDLLARLGAISI